MPKRQYDWGSLRHQFVTSDVTLDDLAVLPDAPAIGTLKNRSAREGWSQLRNKYRDRVVTKTREKAAESAAESSERHIKISRLLQDKAWEALAQIDPSALKPSELLAFMTSAIEIERKALGLTEDKRGAAQALRFEVTYVNEAVSDDD